MITALIIVVLLVAAFLGYVATRPNAFRIQRATRVKAAPESLYPLISDMKKFNTWNPFAKADPDAALTYSGPASGKGASYGWASRKLGVGRMEIVEATPSSRVVAKLDFVKPFEAHNIVEFTLEPKDDSTDVVWAMHGPMPFMSKLMTVFFNQDRMVGGEFEKGLANMKAAAET